LVAPNSVATTSSTDELNHLPDIIPPPQTSLAENSQVLLVQSVIAV
jgi:hypothetical protein